MKKVTYFMAITLIGFLFSCSSGETKEENAASTNETMEVAAPVKKDPETVEEFEEAIRKNKQWMEGIEKKAAERNVSVDEVIKEDALFFLALNTVYTGKGMKMAPDADFSDGLIDIIMFKSATKLQVVNIFLKLFSGKHIYDPRVTYKQVESFSIESEGDDLNIDGENQGFTPIDVRVIKKCITLIK